MAEQIRGPPTPRADLSPPALPLAAAKTNTPTVAHTLSHDSGGYANTQRGVAVAAAAAHPHAPRDVRCVQFEQNDTTQPHNLLTWKTGERRTVENVEARCVITLCLLAQVHKYYTQLISA